LQEKTIEIEDLQVFLEEKNIECEKLIKDLDGIQQGSQWQQQLYENTQSRYWSAQEKLKLKEG